MKKVRVYEYAACSTCKKALKYLDQKKVAYERVAIVEQPPTIAELKKMLSLHNGDFRKLFNTSGVLYREMKLSEKLPTLSEAEALRLLASYGKLIKRPFVLTDTIGLLGFSEENWARAFS